jgi:hypothetical protein
MDSTGSDSDNELSHSTVVANFLSRYDTIIMVLHGWLLNCIAKAGEVISSEMRREDYSLQCHSIWG